MKYDATIAPLSFLFYVLTLRSDIMRLVSEHMVDTRSFYFFVHD